MLNKLLLLPTVLFLMICSVNAQTKFVKSPNPGIKFDNMKAPTLTENQMILGYCTEEVSTNGLGAKEECTIEAAAFFPKSRMSKFSRGSKIKTIRFASCNDKLTDAVVWVRNSVTGQNLVSENVSAVKAGWNEITLSQPYEIDGSAIYIGYSAHQPAMAYSISLAGTDRRDASLLGIDGQWSDFNGSKYGRLSVNCIVEGENLPEFAFSLSELIVNPIFIKNNDEFTIKGSFINDGKTVSGYDLTYQIEGRDPITVQKKTSIKADASTNLEIKVPAGNNYSTGYVNVAVTVTPIDATNPTLSDNGKCRTFVYENSISRNKVLLEQFTTEQCGYCPQGTTRLKSAVGNNENVVWVSHHVGYGEDNFTVVESRQMLPFYGSGGTFAPAMMLDRMTVKSSGSDYPVFSVGAVSDINAAVSKALAAPTFASVNMDGSYDADSRTLNLKVYGNVLNEFIAAADSALFTVYLVEDGVKAVNQASGGSSYIHDHLIRKFLTKGFGDPLEINNNSFSHELSSVVLDRKWNVDNMKVVALVNSLDKDGVINNCPTFAVVSSKILSTFTSINSTQNEADVRVYSANGKVMLDGSYDQLSVYTISGNEVANENLMKGVYIVKVVNSNGTIQKKIFVE